MYKESIASPVTSICEDTEEVPTGESEAFSKMKLAPKEMREELGAYKEEMQKVEEKVEVELESHKEEKKKIGGKDDVGT